ncbi:MAG TPA: nucleoside triphosphate pyrophosphatase [Coriobacteriia bacterium]|nr:nucleoside triphosphate pyrophosphatase [Coriobacteriia bacterium]
MLSIEVDRVSSAGRCYHARVGERSPAPLVLASASPRRRRLFAMLGVEYHCMATEIAEELDSPLASDPRALAVTLAREKAEAARSLGIRQGVLACDTIVFFDGRSIGKPTGLDDARRMLAELSGGTHEVVTGVALLPPGRAEAETFAVTTLVRMRRLADGDIEAWVARGELLGCAGAYNIEHHLGEVDPGECFQNVAGLPLCHLYVELCRLKGALGIGEPTPPAGACDAARQARCLLGPRIIAGAKI